MNRLPFLAASLAAAMCTLPAHAQSLTLANPGYEDQGISPTDALNWREFNTARRRLLGDAFSPAPIVRTGNASMELAPGNVFVGLDTNEFNSSTFLWNDPLYEYGCGPAVFRVWYAIPASNPILTQPGGLKMEFRRDNQSVYNPFEDFMIQPDSPDLTDGQTNGQWLQAELIVWPAQFDFIHLYQNQGMTYGAFPAEAPTRVSLLPLRFGGDWLTETGTIFIDDVEFIQDKTGSEFGEFIAWDDTEVSLECLDQAGVIEPEIPILFFSSGVSTVYEDGDQVGFGCLPSTDQFTAINIVDRVVNTDEFPQTYADLVANGYVRAVVQNLDGTTGSFGTSVITAPSFRPDGQPLDLIPDMSQANLDVTYNFPAFGGVPPEPLEPPLRSDFTITGHGTYGSLATVASTRDYSTDPIVGETTFTVDFTWTADQNINLETARTVGNDAYRLITLSSMFANRASGEYDGSFLEIEEAGGGTTQFIMQDSTPRGAYLFASPVATSVGKKFTLFQDTDATFNPDSPTIEVTIDAITGAPGTIGVQGFLATTTDPNDDSLSVWLEWVDAPPTITSGTVIMGTFTVRALPAVAPPSPCIGDINGDGKNDVFDFGLFAAAFGTFDGEPGYNPEADLDNNGTVNVFDFGIYATDFGCGT